jgi:hypothetical protein
LNFFDIVDDALDLHGIHLKPKRSNYHLNNPDLLRGMIKQSGFEKVLWYNYSCPIYHIDPPEILADLDSYPPFTQFLANMNGDESVEIKRKVLSLIRKRLEEREHLFMFESLVAVAYKQYASKL